MRTTSTVVVQGRQRVERYGIYFARIAGRNRSVYRQVDGEIEFADACKCFTDWQPDFTVTRSLDCPIDEHRILALRELAA